MARPSLYKPEYCERVIEIGETGASIDEMAYELGVTDNTLRNWAEEHEEFFDAFTRAKQASLIWWEKAGRVGMLENNISAPIWSRSMAARFPDKWREVKGTELTGKDGAPIQQQVTKVERTIIDPANTDAS